jgi:alkylation response protein AidB-like acyl-CoA dehydrogenase
MMPAGGLGVPSARGGQRRDGGMCTAAREFAHWLTAFLPDDYYTERYGEYRWDIALRRAYQRAAFEAGWLQPTWPPEHGGRSLGLADAMEVRLEAAVRSAPKLPNIAGPNVAAPAVREFGTPEQVDRLLVPALRGDEWWALGMSEPEAGSDFAGLRTRADRHHSVDGDVFRINGHKIWSTQAHLARWCTLYARTDPTAPKHRGISCFILDLALPGVTIRPIRMASASDETFCEIFLDDVEVPATCLLGVENAGWQVAMSSLRHERQMIWIMNWVEICRALEGMRGADPAACEGLFVELGSLVADAEALRATGYRALANEIAGRPSPEADILKLLGSETLQRVWELRAAAAGNRSSCDPDLLFERQDALAATIYGGTSQIQRNIIGERLLGLPKG